MCGEHKDRVILLLSIGLFLLCATIALQTFVIYLMIDFDDLNRSVEDVKVLSLGCGIVVNILVMVVLFLMYYKANELLQTIAELMGSNRPASQYMMLGSDDYS